MKKWNFKLIILDDLWGWRRSRSWSTIKKIIREEDFIGFYFSFKADAGREAGRDVCCC
jgi:hypothetical protein